MVARGRSPKSVNLKARGLLEPRSGARKVAHGVSSLRQSSPLNALPLGSPRGKAYLRGLDTALTGVGIRAARPENDEEIEHAHISKAYFGIMHPDEFYIRQGCGVLAGGVSHA